MIKQIRLQGLSFRGELDGQRIDFGGRITYLALVPWEFCNWTCRYCHEQQRIKEAGELSTAEMRVIVREAGSLGIRAVLLLGGEVLLRATWPTVQEIVDEAHGQKLITLIYTNGSQLTESMVQWLADRDVSLAFKVDSLDQELCDRLTGQLGALASIMRAIELARKTSIGSVVHETSREKLVRLLFTTVGNALNAQEYVALARFATNKGARWMMEALNHRGDAVSHRELALDAKTHSEAMRIAMALNPEQYHAFDQPCRLFSCVTVRKKGQIAICPQDYSFLGNICELGSLKAACDLVKTEIERRDWRKAWTGVCPIKVGHFVNV